MLFDEDFLAQVTADPVESAIAVCQKVQSTYIEGSSWSHEEYDALLEGYALLQVMKEGNLLSVVVEDPGPPIGDLDDDCKKLSAFLRVIKAALETHVRASRLEKLKSKFAQKLKVQFSYEFSEADLHRIQELINELRENVEGSKLFEKQHRDRLLKRLEHLQQELHKRVADLDRFWGLIGEAGVALGRFGPAAQPFVERISEITEIVWNTQKQSEGLPSTVSLPLLNVKPSEPIG
jgi:cell fate (sporulation/competence/biofilm development) regulator YlbF (YheA/YmcA/DUF963 family)